MKKKVFNLVIVDESGSMSCIREQALTGMNETLSTIQVMQEKYPDTEQFTTLLTFDSEHTTWHLDNASVDQIRKLAWDEYNPNACTPLYDAIGSAISKVEKQVGEGANVLVTIITDGEENSSREWTLPMIRQRIELLKKHGWTFSLIGTDNLDVETMAISMKIDSHISFCQDAAGTKRMFSTERCARSRFKAMVSRDESIEESAYFNLSSNDVDPLADKH